MRRFHQGRDFTLDEFGRNIALPTMVFANWKRCCVAAICSLRKIWQLYSAVHNAIHAHFLLRRDVDYVVKDNAIESVDQFKGRIAQDRRWPPGCIPHWKRKSTCRS